VHPVKIACVRVLALLAVGCGDESSDAGGTPSAQPTGQEPNHEAAPPADSSGSDDAERKLVAGARRELKSTAGWDRWAVDRIEAAGPDDVVAHTGLFPDAEAEPAATGICTTLGNPAFIRIEDLVQVLGSNGDEIELPACEPQ
jgi:hypothetical protein